MRPLFVDLNCALRNLRKTQMFTTTAVSLLAMAIALNGLVFSVINSTLLRPLPYPDAEKLVVLQDHQHSRQARNDLDAATFFFIRDHVSSLEDVTVIYPTEGGINLAGAGAPSYVRALRVSRNFFNLLRIDPFWGRTFNDSEDKPNGERAAVLSYPLWKHILDETGEKYHQAIRINGEEYTVVGVMPQNFRSYPDADLWLPLRLNIAATDPGRDYRVMARIRDGVPEQRSKEELQNLSRQLPAGNSPLTEAVNLVPQPLKEFETGAVRQWLMLLLSAVGFVLLIVCANIAMLLQSRASARTHEIAIRSALGSSLGRLFQLFFLENAVIALLAGLFGTILAKELLPILVARVPATLLRTGDIHIDWRVVLFTFGLSALTAILFGMAPALRFYHFKLNKMLGESSLRATPSISQTRTGRLLLVGQAALTLTLLSSSMLLVRHLLAIQGIGPGFEVRQEYIAQVSLASASYHTTAATAMVLEKISQKLRAFPYIEDVATINGLPLEKGLNVPMRTSDSMDSTQICEYRLVNQDYFSTLRIPVLQGRAFERSDGPLTQPVAIINQTLARRWWPSTSALGRFVLMGEELGPEFTDKPRLVVGVVADIHESSLDKTARPTLYLPTMQAPNVMTDSVNKYFLTSIIARVDGSRDIAPQVRAAIEAADADLPVASFRPFSEVIDASLSRDRFYTLMIGFCGGFALLITGVGLYGLLSYQISLRAREIAVRMSLGARRSQIVSSVVRDGLVLVGTGAALGIPGFFFFRRIFANMLYNVGGGGGGGALADAIVLLIVVALLASVLTSFRIASIEPVVILRK